MLFVYRDKFRGEKIPTLEEAVEECIRLQLIIYFDVKGHPDEVQAKQAKQELDTSNIWHTCSKNISIHICADLIDLLHVNVA